VEEGEANFVEAGKNKRKRQPRKHALVPATYPTA